MEEEARSYGGWESSPQISNLLAMADPESSENLPGGMQLRHMHLDKQRNDFVKAKNAKLGLADYQQATKWKRRVVEKEKTRREQEQQARKAALKAAEEEDERRRQREIDELPAYQQTIKLFKRFLSGITVDPPLNKDLFSELSGQVKQLAKTAINWSADERQAAADAIEHAFDRFGWTPSGLSRNKREKQLAKRRQLIKGLREGV